MTDITPVNIEAAASAVNTVADNPITPSISRHIPKGVRGVLYEVGKWIGVAGATAGVVAGALEGTPALYAAAAASLLLAASNLLAKAHLSD